MHTFTLHLKASTLPEYAAYQSFGEASTELVCVSTLAQLALSNKEAKRASSQPAD